MKYEQPIVWNGKTIGGIIARTAWKTISREKGHISWKFGVDATGAIGWQVEIFETYGFAFDNVGTRVVEDAKVYFLSKERFLAIAKHGNLGWGNQYFVPCPWWDDFNEVHSQTLFAFDKLPKV